MARKEGLGRRACIDVSSGRVSGLVGNWAALSVQVRDSEVTSAVNISNCFLPTSTGPLWTTLQMMA